MPVHLVRPDETGLGERRAPCVIDGVTTVDLADVIGLVRHHGLTSEFAEHLDKPLRRAFRKIVRLIEQRPE